MKIKKLFVAVPWFGVFCFAFAMLWKGGKTLESILAWAFISNLSLFALLGFLFFEKKAMRFSWVKLGFPLLFLLGTFLSFLNSETKNVGMDELWLSIAMVSLYLVLVYRPAFAPLQNFETKFFRSAPSIFLISFILGLNVYINEPVNRFVGSFFDYRFHTDFWPNAWAQFLLLLWPMIAVGLIGRLSSWPRKIAALLLAALVLGALALSYSRGASLAFAFQGLLLGGAFLWSLRAKKIGERARQLGQKLLGILVVGLLAWGVFVGINALRAPFQPVQSVVEKVTFQAQEGKSSVNERAQFWGQAWQMFLEKPILGYGPYSFRYIQGERMEGVLASSDHAHNLFLKLASERGFATALSFTLWMVLLAIQSANYFLFQKKSKVFWQGVFLWIAVAGVLAHNMIDYNLQFVGILAPFTLALALLARPIPDQAVMPEYRISKRFLIPLGGLLALWMLYLSFEGMMQSFMYVARGHALRQNYSEAMIWMQRADATLLPKDLHLKMAENMEFQGDFEQALAFTLEYGAMNKHDLYYWKRRSFYEKNLHQKEAARVSIERAMQMGALQDAQIFRLYLEAEHDLDLFIRRQDLIPLFDQYIQAVLENAHFIALSGTPEELVKIAELLAQKYPRMRENFENKAKKALEHAKVERARLDARAF